MGRTTERLTTDERAAWRKCCDGPKWVELHREKILSLLDDAAELDAAEAVRDVLRSALACAGEHVSAVVDGKCTPSAGEWQRLMRLIDGTLAGNTPEENP